MFREVVTFNIWINILDLVTSLTSWIWYFITVIIIVVVFIIIIIFIIIINIIITTKPTTVISAVNKNRIYSTYPIFIFC